MLQKVRIRETFGVKEFEFGPVMNGTLIEGLWLKLLFILTSHQIKYPLKQKVQNNPGRRRNESKEQRVMTLSREGIGTALLFGSKILSVANQRVLGPQGKFYRTQGSF